MEQSYILEKVASWVEKKFVDDTTGHDYWHIQRVVQMTRFLAKRENADPFVCEMAAYLHDVADEKLTNDIEGANKEIMEFLVGVGVSHEKRMQIFQAMNEVSFKGNHQVPKTLEGKIVQDADRLDAIGAIGIARTFAYGGSKGYKMYEPNMSEELEQADYRAENKTSIYHFYEKLLKLKDLMNTNTAKNIAEKRHQFMESFLQQFYMEWEGTDL